MVVNKFRFVHTSTLEDAWYQGLDPTCRLVFLTLLLVRQIEPCGVAEVTVGALQLSTGIDGETVKGCLKGLEPKVVWWPERSLVFIRNYYQYQSARSHPTYFVIAAERSVKKLDPEVRTVVLARYPELGGQVTDLGVSGDGESPPADPEPAPSTPVEEPEPEEEPVAGKPERKRAARKQPTSRSQSKGRARASSTKRAGRADRGSTASPAPPALKSAGGVEPSEGAAVDEEVPPPAPTKHKPNDLMTALIDKLTDVDPKWGKLCTNPSEDRAGYAALQKLINAHGPTTVTSAMQRLQESKTRVTGESPYPLLSTVCKMIEREAAS